MGEYIVDKIRKNFEDMIKREETELKDDMEHITANIRFHLPFRAESAYIASYKIATYKTILEELLDALTIQEIESVLSKYIAEYTARLTKGCLVQSSTQMMHNLCSLWISKANQDLLERFETQYKFAVKNNKAYKNESN